MDFLSASMFLPGEHSSGQDVRTNNVEACIALANQVRTTLGPIGLDKMLVDDVGDVDVTNDGATILKKLAVEHPAAKVLVELSDLQDREVGDGTTSVVIFASELLRRANELIKNKVHPTNVMSGYRLAARKATQFLKKFLCVASGELTREQLLMVARTSMSSKIISLTSDHFSKLVVDAMLAIKSVASDGTVRAPVRAVNILKSHGKSSTESCSIDGYALNSVRASQEMPRQVRDARIALIDFNLQQVRLIGMEILITDPSKLEDVKRRELDITKERIDKILSAGANVILTTGAIDSMAQSYLVERGVMGVRRCEREDLRRIARITGGSLVASLADMEGDESFEPAFLGHADEVVEARVADSHLTFVRGGCKHSCGSILLRGPNTHMIDELDRSVHDALCAVSRALESGSLVAGGGAVETALSVFLENYGSSLGSREQLAVLEFARALLIIPKTLAVNAAKDSAELVAQLRSAHAKAQTAGASADDKALRFMGLDLYAGETRDNVSAGVLEPAMSKMKSIQFAAEAAITILRIDDVIKLEPEEKQQRR